MCRKPRLRGKPTLLKKPILPVTPGQFKKIGPAFFDPERARAARFPRAVRAIIAQAPPVLSLARIFSQFEQLRGVSVHSLSAMKPISKSFVGFVTGLTGLLAVVALCHVNFKLFGKDAAPEIKVEKDPVIRDSRTVTSYAPIVKTAAPSVVNIFTTRIVRNTWRGNPLFQLFGGGEEQNDRPATHKEESLGSGVIVSANGYILTANHVVDDADVIKVAINNTGKQYAARVVGKDKLSDVAVLKIDAKDLPAITLSDSDQLEVGDVVLAIGDPFGVGQTVTMGIISALGRNVEGFGQYEDFIQTDAAINPGNSGGALVDAEGRLVGINTAIISPSEGNSGIGFAVPVNLARHVMEQLISGGKVTRGFLGVSPTDLTPDLASEFNVPAQGGALVNDVFPNTPAKKAGVKSGDVIVSLNGKAIADANSLSLIVSELSPGTSVELKVYRDGSPKTIKVMLGELPGSFSKTDEDNSGNDTSSTTDSLDGVTVGDLDADARQELHAPDPLKGVVVDDVQPDSNAAEAGLEKGDVIVEINHHPVITTDDAIRLCKDAKGDHILLKVWHREAPDFARTRFLSVDNTKSK
jgi:serine protease Do